MNAVVYSLWGKDPTYRVGALRNIDLINEFYGPAWTPIFYVLPSAFDMIDELRKKGAEVRKVESLRDGEGLYARLIITRENKIKRFVVRDTDSRPGYREAEMVREWIRSGRGFHFIKDHHRHTSAIMGGMWGAISSCMPVDFCDTWMRRIEYLRDDTNIIDRTAGGRYGRWSDQGFLYESVWPLAKENCIIHTRSSLPGLREGDFFIGQQWHVKDGREIPIWVR